MRRAVVSACLADRAPRGRVETAGPPTVRCERRFSHPRSESERRRYRSVWLGAASADESGVHSLSPERGV